MCVFGRCLFLTANGRVTVRHLVYKKARVEAQSFREPNRTLSFGYFGLSVFKDVLLYFKT